MSNRILFMQNHQSEVVPANSYCPFHTIVTRQPQSGNSMITYSESEKRFSIPVASVNDYHITWQIALKTCSSPEYPIAGIEYEYSGQVSTDYMIFPSRTMQIANFSVYHTTTVSDDDLLKLGLKLIGDTPHSYTISSLSDHMVSASISIMAL